MLSVFGWLGGWMVAGWGLGVLKTQIPPNVPNYDQIALNPGVAAVAFMMVVIFVVLLGFLPGLKTLRLVGLETVSSGQVGSPRVSGGHRVSVVFAVFQIATAVILMTGSGLLLKSFDAFCRFPSDSIRQTPWLSTSFSPEGKHTNALQAEFLDTALERIRALPSVVEASALMRVPLRSPLATLESGSPFAIAGRDEGDADGETRGRVRFTTRGYFRAMGIARLAGRDFDTGDTPNSPPVVIVNEAFTERTWRGGVRDRQEAQAFVG